MAGHRYPQRDKKLWLRDTGCGAIPFFVCQLHIFNPNAAYVNRLVQKQYFKDELFIKLGELFFNKVTVKNIIAPVFEANATLLGGTLTY